MWESELVFRKHSLDNFREAFNQVRENYNAHDKFTLKGAPQWFLVSSNAIYVLEDNMAITSERSSRQAKVNTDISDVCEEDTPDGKESRVLFMYFHLISSWMKPRTGISRLSVAIHLLSGVKARVLTLRV